MRNIRLHKINLPPEIIEKCWGIYFKKYKKIEDKLKDKAEFDLPLRKNVHITGAFQLPISTLKGIPTDALTKYFISSGTNQLTIRTKTKIVLRGQDYFIGLSKLSNKDKFTVIFTRLEEMIDILSSISKTANLVLYLGLLDYVRNYLMILLYAINQTTREMANFSQISNEYLIFNELVKRVEEQYLHTLLEHKITPIEDLKPYTPSLLSIKEYLIDSLLYVERNKKLSDDLIRKSRECNHPVKIFKFASTIAHDFFPRKAVLIGIEYGGIELPYVINAYRKILGKSELGLLTANLSSYSTGSKKHVDYIDDAISPFLNKKCLEKYDTAVMLDDSVTTGRTVEYLTELLPNNIERINLSVVSYTNTNRYHH